MLIDTHAHLDTDVYDEDRKDVIQRALDQGVTRIVNIGFNRQTIPSTLKLTEEYDFIYAAVGWHPQDANDLRAADLDWIEELCRKEKVVAIGEIGLDYYWDSASREVQWNVFREQIRLARKLGMPIVIHDRDAHQDILRLLKEEKASDVGGIMHCFSGDWEMARECLAMNFYISFGGPVTFKNAKQPKEVLAQVPPDKLLIETDSPYLTPHPFRGKRNESGYVRFVAEAAAAIKQIPIEQLAEITSRNARNILGIK